MAIRRLAARLAALVAPFVLLVTMVQPARAEFISPPGPTSGFAGRVKKAVSAAFGAYSVREHRTSTSESDVAKPQRVRTDLLAFSGRARGRVLGVVRSVGAIRETTRTTVSGRVLGTVKIPRPGAGTRTAIVTTTADQWGPGLTVVSWTERRGVNYQLVGRGGVSRRQLVKLARMLPKDTTKASAAARAAIAKAKPLTAPAQHPAATGGVTATGTSNLTVDGAGTITDDLGNEATLCAGCSYSSGNYAGFWQYVLYADAKLAWSGVDCVFGGSTASATKSWQSAEGLSADGVVGANTRGRADNNLYASGTDAYYLGTARTIGFFRSSSTGFYWYSGTRLSYGYSGGTLTGC